MIGYEGVDQRNDPQRIALKYPASASPAATPMATALLSAASALFWLGWLCAGAALLAALWSHSPLDHAFFQVGPGLPAGTEPGGLAAASNWLGRPGAWVSDAVYFLLGGTGHLLAVFFFSMGWLSLRAGQRLRQTLVLHPPGSGEPLPPLPSLAEAGLLPRLAGLLMALPMLAALEAQWFPEVFLPSGIAPGGALGSLVGSALEVGLTDLGASAVALLVASVGIRFAFGISYLAVFEVLGRGLATGIGWAWAWMQASRDRRLGSAGAEARASRLQTIRAERPEPEFSVVDPEPIEPAKRPRKESAAVLQQPLFDELPPDPARAGALPPLRLLAPAPAQASTISPETLAYTSQLIETRLADFNVQVKVVSALPGPVITRFEIEPALGVKGSQIVGLSRDLARALAVTSVRVVETIPGKNLMGLELPNPQRQTVRLSEILGSQAFSASRAALPLAMGKDISGQPVVADLAKMPHLLVAGTTGSGKSVGINAMLLSLVYHLPARDLRLILIDPKMLELSVYEDIPHLLTPVVTDMKLAANALHWCVGEMERRYRLMSKLGVRNLAGYNSKVEEALKRGSPIPDPTIPPEMVEAGGPPMLEPLPHLVVVIDELADLMMVVGKKVEELIARLAGKARASGIHLILATQRPSVDVITGLIKANVPSRVAFQVSSRVDSRTILDQMGAESLLGMGDMLYLPPGVGMPTRVHGAFVADDEVLAVVEYLKTVCGGPNYDESILDGADAESSGGGTFLAGLEKPSGDQSENDPLYDEAVAVVLKHRKASISLVQRHLRIGYNRSARLLDAMEQAGLVSAMQSNGNRDIMVPPSAGSAGD